MAKIDNNNAKATKITVGQIKAICIRTLNTLNMDPDRYLPEIYKDRERGRIFVDATDWINFRVAVDINSDATWGDIKSYIAEWFAVYKTRCINLGETFED